MKQFSIVLLVLVIASLANAELILTINGLDVTEPQVTNARYFSAGE